HGLEPLKVDWELSRVAQEKSRDMALNDYFSHNSPTYGSPFQMMQDWGISYTNAGENIAKGQLTPSEVVNAWMNSEGHRANILNEEFTHIGVGCYEKGNHWTQQCIGKYTIEDWLQPVLCSIVYIFHSISATILLKCFAKAKPYRGKKE